MKILLISQLYPYFGGVQTWAREYIKYCKNHNIDVHVVDASVTGKRSVDSNDRVDIKEEVNRCFSIWKNIKKELKGNKFDVVHLNSACSSKGIVRDYISAKLIKRFNSKLIVHCHCNIEDQLKGNTYFFDRLVRLADKVLVLNEESYNFTLKYKKDNVYKVPNFIDKSFVVDKKEINDEIKNILYVGHIRHTKGINEILEASKAFKDINFLLVGPMVDKDLEAKQDNVSFLGPKDHDEIKDLLNKCDVFLFPSYTEGFSLSLLEAMAYGLPIIATDVGANKETIGDGGIIVKTKDSDSIVDALNKLNDKKIRKQMSLYNIDRVKTLYTSDVVLDKLVKLYE